MRGPGKSLRALRVFLACLLLGASAGAIAARPAAPIVMVEAAGRRGVDAARAATPAAFARTTPAPRPAWAAREAAAPAALRARLRTQARRAARRAPSTPSYILRHALLR